MEATTDAVTQAQQHFALAAETLTGDIRDAMLTHVRSMDIPWSKLSERQQGEKLDAIQKLSDDLVRRSVRIIADQGFPHLIVHTGKWAVGETIDLKVGAAPTIDNITRLAEHGLGSAVLVLTEVGQFFGQRQEVRAEPDQRAMPLDGDEGDVDDETVDATDGDSESSEEAAADADTQPTEEPVAEKPTRRNRRVIRETEAA